MKKYYEAPSVEKIAFAYRDQVVVASGNTYVCSQQWNEKDEIGTTCTHTVLQKDSGF